MKVLVTGANGYIGQGLVKKLLEDHVDVIATDFRLDHVSGRAKKVPADLFSLEDPYSYFGHPDAVFHLAWRNGFVHNDPSHMEDLPKHYSFLKKMVESGLPHLAVMGSMHEVGFYEGSIKEDTPCNPQSLYGIAKNALRQATELLCKEHDTVFQWVRGFYIVGNTQYGCSIFSKLTAAEMRGDLEFPFTMGQNQWDFIDYGPFCTMLAAIVEQEKYCGIINACSGYPEKLKDRVETFIRENQYEIQLKYGAFPDRPYDSKAVWGDDTIVRKILAEHPAVMKEQNLLESDAVKPMGDIDADDVETIHAGEAGR